MIRVLALAALLGLGACHRHEAETAPDADADLRNATAAKTLADLQAAEDAAKAPLPRPIAPVVHREALAAPAAEESDDADSEDNSAAPTDLLPPR